MKKYLKKTEKVMKKIKIPIGACATTTNFSTIKISILKFYCRGVSHEKKQCFWTISPLPPTPTPLKSANFIFIVVSLSLILGKALRVVL